MECPRQAILRGVPRFRQGRDHARRPRRTGQPEREDIRGSGSGCLDSGRDRNRAGCCGVGRGSAASRQEQKNRAAGRADEMFKF